MAAGCLLITLAASSGVALAADYGSVGTFNLSLISAQNASKGFVLARCEAGCDGVLTVRVDPPELAGWIRVAPDVVDLSKETASVNATLLVSPPEIASPAAYTGALVASTTAGDRWSYDLKLAVKLPPPRLAVATQPAGAQIYVNGVYYGLTPLEVPGIEPGAAALRVLLPGYEEHQETLRLGPGQSKTVDVRLTPSGSPWGWLVLGAIVTAAAGAAFLYRDRWSKYPKAVLSGVFPRFKARPSGTPSAKAGAKGSRAPASGGAGKRPEWLDQILQTHGLNERGPGVIPAPDTPERSAGTLSASGDSLEGPPGTQAEGAAPVEAPGEPSQESRIASIEQILSYLDRKVQGVAARKDSPPPEAEVRLRELDSRLLSLPKAEDLQRVLQRLEEIETAQEALRASVRARADAEAKAPAPGLPSPTADVTTLKEDIASLQKSVEALRKTASEQSKLYLELVDFIDSSAAPISDVAAEAEGAREAAGAATPAVQEPQALKELQEEVAALKSSFEDLAELRKTIEGAQKGLPGVQARVKEFESLTANIESLQESIRGLEERLEDAPVSQAADPASPELRADIEFLRQEIREQSRLMKGLEGRVEAQQLSSARGEETRSLFRDLSVVREDVAQLRAIFEEFQKRSSTVRVSRLQSMVQRLQEEAESVAEEIAEGTEGPPAGGRKRPVSNRFSK